RPMDILHDEGHGSAPAETLEQDDEDVEQSGLGPFRRRARRAIAGGLEGRPRREMRGALEESRHEPGQLPRGWVDESIQDRPVLGSDEAAERLGDRSEREALVRPKAHAAALEGP